MLSHQMTGILKGTRAPQKGVNFLETLEYVIDALTTLTLSKSILEAAENGTEVLKNAVQVSPVSPDLLCLVTSLNDPPLDGFFKKARRIAVDREDSQNVSNQLAEHL